MIKKILQKILLGTFAVSITSISIGIVVAGTVAARNGVANVLLSSLLAVALVLAAHLLPSLMRNRAAWELRAALALWAACFAVTIYNQVVFFAASDEAAGASRVAQSVIVKNSGDRIAALKSQIANINVRPLIKIEREISWTTDEKRLAVLRVEKEQAQLKDNLEVELQDALKADSDVRKSESNGVASVLLASATSSNTSNNALILFIVKSSLLELLGMFFWRELLVTSNTATPKIMPESVSKEQEQATEESPDDVQLAAVKSAVEAGKIKPTVREICAHLSCSTRTAMELRRLLVAA